ncbi:hypothetical protein BOTBODRAFT_298787 [Botryobasidium botryosum FD-172 SS1]|uniref:Uncharacterized protein n=1 Tax=Botryobasidium botryosum (strain FD-172 SS1) TaxID=930990 RepID=A0A067LRW7_BOTB1|nr:hypothetical protein BOTBODRAFT_298787 [Botryobasidium botryosum FD-172 SS1]
MKKLRRSQLPRDRPDRKLPRARPPRQRSRNPRRRSLDKAPPSGLMAREGRPGCPRRPQSHPRSRKLPRRKKSSADRASWHRDMQLKRYPPSTRLRAGLQGGIITGSYGRINSHAGLHDFQVRRWVLG